MEAPNAGGCHGRPGDKEGHEDGLLAGLFGADAFVCAGSSECKIALSNTVASALAARQLP